MGVDVGIRRWRASHLGKSRQELPTLELLISAPNSRHAGIPAPLSDNFVQCTVCRNDWCDHQLDLLKGCLGGAASNEVGGPHQGDHTDVHEFDVFSYGVTREEHWGVGLGIMCVNRGLCAGHYDFGRLERQGGPPLSGSRY